MSLIWNDAAAAAAAGTLRSYQQYPYLSSHQLLLLLPDSPTLARVSETFATFSLLVSSHHNLIPLLPSLSGCSARARPVGRAAVFAVRLSVAHLSGLWMLSGRPACGRICRVVSTAIPLLQQPTRPLHLLPLSLARPLHFLSPLTFRPARRSLLSVSCVSPVYSSPCVRHASSQSNSASSQQPQSSAPELSSTSMSASVSSSQSVSASSPSASQPSAQSFWQYWTSEPLSHTRFSALWWRDTVVILVVFSITGSLSLLVVKPLLSSLLGVSGSMRDGPNSYRLLSVLLVPPAYSVMLVTIGTLVGQHHYFRKVALRMWGRMLPKGWIGQTKGQKTS